MPLPVRALGLDTDPLMVGWGLRECPVDRGLRVRPLRAAALVSSSHPSRSRDQQEQLIVAVHRVGAKPRVEVSKSVKPAAKYGTIRRRSLGHSTSGSIRSPTHGGQKAAPHRSRHRCCARRLTNSRCRRSSRTETKKALHCGTPTSDENSRVQGGDLGPQAVTLG